jgi:hypothetical protein
MATIQIGAQLDKERKKLAELTALRERIEIEIAKTKRKVAAWAELCEECDTAGPPIDLDLGGLTQACITALRGSRKEWLNTTEIQAALKELGFPISQYKAPNASIATTVNRLVDDGVVVADKRLGAGATEYKWVGKVPADFEMDAAKMLKLVLENEKRDK